MITQTYKKRVYGGIFVLVLVLSIFLTSAALGDNLDFDRIKTATTTILDNSINRIENAISTVTNNPKLDQVIKDNVIANLTAMKTALTNYETKVQNTTSLAELRTLNQEIIQYIKDNKDVIRNNIRMALINLGQKVVDKANEFIKEVEDLLKVMKNRTCTEQADKITEVEGQLESLQTSINTLEQAVSTKDTITIKKEVKNIKTLGKSIFDNMKTLEEMC